MIVYSMYRIAARRGTTNRYLFEWKRCAGEWIDSTIRSDLSELRIDIFDEDSRISE